MRGEGLRGQRPPAGLVMAAGFHGHQQVKGLGAGVIKDLGRVMLFVGEHQGRLRIVGLAAQNLLGQIQQFGSGLGDGAGTGSAGEYNGLVGFGIQREEGLGLFAGLGLAVGVMPAHLPFGGTLDAVWVQDQETSAEMAAGPAQFAQGDLQTLRGGHGVGGEQIVNGLIAGDEGQTVG